MNESSNKTAERKMVSVHVNESSSEMSSVSTKKHRGKKFKFKYYLNANCRGKKASSVSTKGSSDYDLWFTKLKGPLYERFTWVYIGEDDYTPALE